MYHHPDHQHHHYHHPPNHHHHHLLHQPVTMKSAAQSHCSGVWIIPFYEHDKRVAVANRLTPSLVASP